jgi:hypothetical protein
MLRVPQNSVYNTSVLCAVYSSIPFSMRTVRYIVLYTKTLPLEANKISLFWTVMQFCSDSTLINSNIKPNYWELLLFLIKY